MNGRTVGGNEGNVMNVGRMGDEALYGVVSLFLFFERLFIIISAASAASAASSAVPKLRCATNKAPIHQHQDNR